MEGRDHGHWSERLSEYLDGELETAAAEEFDRHLSGCASCRAVLADLERVRRWAREHPPVAPRHDLWPGIRRALGQSQGDAPPSDRTGHRVRPWADGAVQRAEPRGGTRAHSGAEGRGDALDRGPDRGVFVRIPQLVAAGIVLFLLGAAGGAVVLGSWDRSQGTSTVALAPEPGPNALGLDPAPVADAWAPAAAELEPLAREGRQLQARLEAAADRLDPVTVEVLRRNLAVIDRAIREATEALTRQPEDPYVREHLVRAWERRADVLRQVVDVATWQEAD